VAGDIVLISFPTVGWMAILSADQPNAGVKASFTPWSGPWIGRRNSDEISRNESYNDEKNKRVGLEIRHDTYTGNAIYTVTESGSIAAAPDPLSYVLRTLKSADGVHVYRLQAYTGEVCVWGDGDAWQVISSASAGGAYDLISTPVGDEGNVNAMRIEQLTGETWWVNSVDGPKKLAEPSKAV
jgi:hypothetical protein